MIFDRQKDMDKMFTFCRNQKHNTGKPTARCVRFACVAIGEGPVGMERSLNRTSTGVRYRLMAATRELRAEGKTGILLQTPDAPRRARRLLILS